MSEGTGDEEQSQRDDNPAMNKRGYYRVPTAQLDELTRELRHVAESLIRLEGRIVPREEIEREDNKRVTVERFEATLGAVADRLERLEDSPVRVLGWLGLASGIVTPFVVYLMLHPR